MYTVKGACRIGLDHKREGTNAQDAYSFRVGNRWIVAAVCDGCGSGKRSETGASRAAEYLTLRMVFELEGKDNYLTPFKIANVVYEDYLFQLQLQLDANFYKIRLPEETHEAYQKTFIEENLLHTALMVAVEKSSGNAYFFTKGDGYILINNMVKELRSDNDSGGGVIYPALGLRNPNYNYHARKPFNKAYVPAQWDKLAIASDGLRFVPSDKIDNLLFAGDNDEHFLANSFQFASEDGWLRNEDDLTVVTIERLEG